MSGKPLRCRLGMHSWEDRRNDDGDPYVVCTRCGDENEKIHLSDYGDTGGGSMG